jgi:ankyrin repeat protein
LRDLPLEEWISLHDRIEMYKIRRYGSARSLLYIFTERNLFHLFQVEVGQGQAINVKGGQYDFPIIAAALGNIQMLELLLEHGADPNKRGEGYKHAVFAAVDKSNAPALEVLIRHDAVSPISSTRDFFSALLSLAVKRKNVLITKLLLQYREGSAAEGVCAPQHFRSLIEDAIDNESDEILQILIKSGVIGPALPDDCCFALVKASTNGKEALVRRFLDKSGPCYAGDDAIFSGQPLLAAAKHNHEAIVRILIDNGADINALDRDGSAPLHVACIDGDKATVRIMLNNGAEVNMLDSYERTGLHWACDKKHEAIVRILLDNGVDINTRDRDGRTGFHWACYRRSEAIVRILLDDGADINAMDQTGRTGLYWACHWGHEAIVRILLDNGADVNRGDSRFAVFVSRLVSCDVRENIMSTLLKYGADPNQYSLDRDLLLHRALAMGMTNIVKLLLDHGADVHIPSSKYEDASRALNSCADPEKRAACETLLLEKSVERSSVPYLTWVNGTAYLNFTQQTF